MRRAVAATALLVLVASGCSPTTYDSSDTAPDSVVTTTTLPSGTTTELMTRWLEQSRGLSTLIADSNGEKEAMGLIDNLWAGITQDVGAKRPELLGGFEGVLAMQHRAVDGKRPADADKAYRNLDALITSFTG